MFEETFLIHKLQKSEEKDESEAVVTDRNK